ncbi:hypothetical protein F4782DRAFT_484384 [Xylaria castorea]|nr:hypothetical protein F4782DRAFT_484384 [Xylaria castorea]
MASPTVFFPTPTLPASITSPPTAQFTPGPGCIDPEDHWVVVTSCAAIALGEDYSLSPSPDWLTCQLTQFGPPQNGPASCYVPYSAQTVVDAETRFYSGCPSGYAGASTLSISRADRLETYFDVFCCPTQYNFNADDYFTGGGGYMEFTTERDGVSYSVGYPLPGCATSHISELSGSEIAVQTQFNTHGWEKRQIANVPWDYLYGTMYAEIQSYSYTVFHGTHTCYQDCSGWHNYYFSGSVEPPFTAIDTVPVTTTPVEGPTTTAPTSSEGETGTPPIEETGTTPVEETDGPSTPPAGAQTTSSPTGEDTPPTTSSIELTPTPTPSGSNGNITSSSPSPPSSTTSDVLTGTAAVVTPTLLVLLGLFLSLIAL